MSLSFLSNGICLQDGLFLVTNSIELVRGYHLAVLTPNVNEYKRLVQKVLDSEVNDESAPQQLLLLAKRCYFPINITISFLGRLIRRDFS